MSDLISRQAAIDFINAGRLCNPNELRWSDNDVLIFLKCRPSVEPEQKKANLTVPIVINFKDVEGYLSQHNIVEVVRCKDCQWYDPSSPYGTVSPVVYRCKLNGTYHTPDFFCKSGDRGIIDETN